MMIYDIVFTCPEVIGSKIGNRPHMGIAYLRSFLKYNGFNNSYARHKELFSLKEYIAFLESFNTKIYGFSITDDSLSLFIIISRELRNRCNNAKIIVGGAIAKPEAADYLLKNKYCDAVIIGEGEIPCAEYIRFMKNESDETIIPGVASWDFYNNKVVYIKNKSKIDINSYPSPILTGIIEDEDLTENGLFSSRGCFHQCIYCSFSTSSEWNVRYYDEARFLDEVKTVADATKIYNPNREIPIWDDAFTLSISRAKRLLRSMISMDLGVSFWLQTRVDRIDEELVSLLKEAGVDHVGIGLESASPKVLKMIRKVRLKDFDSPGFEPEEEYIKKFLNFVQLAKKYKLSYTINTIIGLPGETFKDALETMKFVHSLRPKYYFHNYLRLYTGVPLTQKYTYYGYTISAINQKSGDNKALPVQAKVEKYNYDITKVPPLPYRSSSSEINVISGLVDETVALQPTIILGYEYKTLGKLLNSKILHKKQVYKYRTNNSNSDKVITHTLSSVGDFLSLEFEKDIHQFSELSISELNNFYKKLIVLYKADDYKRYSEQADTVIALKTDNEADYKYLNELTEILENGGGFQLPDNFSSFQFKKLIIKNACKWSINCPAKNGMRIYVDEDNCIKTCVDGPCFNLEDAENNIRDYFKKTEKKRNCRECNVKRYCSKCVAVPDELVPFYCKLQKRRIKPFQAVNMLNYLLVQLTNPTELSIFETNKNKLIVPTDNLPEQLTFILKLSRQNYFIIYSIENNKIFKIPDIICDCLIRIWNGYDVDRIKVCLYEEYKLTKEQENEVVENVIFLEQKRRKR